MNRFAPVFAALSVALAASGCSREEEPVANRFERQKAEIENKARALEAEVENDVVALESGFENEASAVINSLPETNAAETAPAEKTE